jgi:hypothetical protein
MRDEILASVVSKAFDDESVQIVKDLQSLARRVYDDVYPEDVRQKLQAVPPEFLNMCFSVCASFGGDIDSLVFGNDLQLPISHKHERYNGMKMFPPSHPICKAHEHLKQRQISLKDRRNKARLDAKAVLFGCTTTKQLVSAWPEVASFVEKYIPTGDGKSPPVVALAVCMKDLNKVLGL